MARTKITPRKLALGLASVNVILAPAAQGAMHHGGTTPVAQLGIGVAGAAPHRLNKLSLDFYI
jgi:hypothetical protein